MLSRFVAIALSLLGLSLGACTTKDDRTTLDPGGPVEIPPVPRDVVDSGLVILNLDADVYGPGGSTGLIIPDAGPRPDLAPVLDAAVDLGCQQAGFLPGGSNCEPTSSSPDSRCTPGYVCVVGFCTALCHLGQASTTECIASIGNTCKGFGTSDVVGYCD
jgi:hypothetical protein